MSWNTPPSFAGTPDDADWLIIANDFRFLHTPPSCSVSHNANQALATGTEVALDMNTELGDTDGMHSTSVNIKRITFQTAGRYYVNGRVTVAANSSGGRRATIRENGSDVEARHAISVTNTVPGNPVDTYLVPETVFDYVATDYIELVAFHNSVTTPLNALANQILLCAHWLSA